MSADTSSRRKLQPPNDANDVFITHDEMATALDEANYVSFEDMASFMTGPAGPEGPQGPPGADGVDREDGADGALT